MKTGVIIRKVVGLNFGQTVDILARCLNDTQLLVHVHGEPKCSNQSLSTNSILSSEDAYDYAKKPLTVNPYL